MEPPPRVLGGANVLVWAALDQSVEATRYRTDAAGGAGDGPVVALAIGVRSGRTREYCVFHCDRAWRVLADTRHETLELAQRQAEAEYTGIAGLWRTRA
jgi:hypothetical protein